MSAIKPAIKLTRKFQPLRSLKDATPEDALAMMFNLSPILPLDGFYVFSKFFPELKVLDGSQFGLFALMLLFISGLGTTLYTASDLPIRALLR